MPQTSTNSTIPSPSRLLVVPLRFIGDTVLSIPLIRNIKEAFPACQVDILVSNTAKTLLNDCPYADNLVTEPRGVINLARQLSSSQYDTVLILRKSVTVALAARLAGIPVIAGYDKQRYFPPIGYKRWGLGLTHKIAYPSLNTEMHQVHSHLRFLSLFGKEPVSDHLELWASKTDQDHVSQLLQSHHIHPESPMAVIHTVSASKGKTIPAEALVNTVKALHAKGYTILCTGLQEDIERYQALSQASGIPLQNLAGKTTLAQTYALLSSVTLMITVDSGPIHLAAAAGVPHIIGIYGPTNEKQWAPLSKNSRFYPVLLREHPQLKTHNDDTVDFTPEVIRKLSTELENTLSRFAPAEKAST